jgi:hypothetical protein
MRGAGLILLGLAFVCVRPAGATSLQNDGSLNAPGDFSLAPAPPGLPPGGSGSILEGPLAGSLPGASPKLVQGGVVSQSFGSNGMRSTAIELDSGLIGGNTRASLLMATGQGPRFHDLPTVSGRSVAVGVQTALPYGFTVGVTAGVDQDRLSRGGALSTLR